jgi:DNA primase
MIFSSIEDIKNRLDIVEVIGSYIKLQKCGANYRAPCPFHSEKKPSFFISPSRQIWHCFGCGKGGDIFGFVKEIERIEFGDALRLLAQKAGVQVKPMKPELKTKRENLYEICELACKFFEKQLESNQIGKTAKDYLLKRGITEGSIKKWRLGYAPDSFRSLSDFLISNSYKIEEIAEAGLAIKKDSGNYFDRFQSRIMFPVFDLNSQVIGFGGRIFGPKEKNEIAKYVNTPSTLLYDKSRILYGLDKSKIAISQKGSIILVEGYTDCILSHQAGYENVVSSSGTALTIFQLKILKRYSSNLILSFDMDLAGDTATKRSIDLAQSLDFDIKVITMPEDQDPADVISKDPKLWEEAINKAKSILDFYFETTFVKFDKNNPSDKKEAAKILLPVIKNIPNKIIQSHWMQKLATILGVRMEDVEEEMRKTKLESSFLEEEIVEEKKDLCSKSRKERIEERLLSLIFRKPNFQKIVEYRDLSLMSEKVSAIISKFKKFFNEEENIPDFQIKFSNFQKELSPDDINFINPLVLKAEVDEECSEIEPDEEAELCLSELRCFCTKNELEDISRQIKTAENIKDSEKTETLVKKFNELSKKLINK